MIHRQLESAARGWGVLNLATAARRSAEAFQALRVRAASPGGSGAEEDMQEFFRRFFGQPLPGMPRQSPRPGQPGPGGQGEGETQPRGVGSGFILTPTASS